MAIEWKRSTKPDGSPVDYATVGRWHLSVYMGYAGIIAVISFPPTGSAVHALGRHVIAASSHEEGRTAALTWIRDTCNDTLTALGDAS